MQVQEAQRDLRKLKAESTGYFKGGWGTFFIAFEDKKRPKMLTDRGDLSDDGLGSARRLAKSPGREQSAHRDGETTSLPSQVSSLSNYENERKDAGEAPHPIEKIKHFVEVGFLVDSIDFRLINTTDEVTYESNLKKYLFEFQDSLSNSQMNALEFKVKQQLTENIGLFNEINPVYISLNMGRPCTAFADDYIPQD